MRSESSRSKSALNLFEFPNFSQTGYTGSQQLYIEYDRVLNQTRGLVRRCGKANEVNEANPALQVLEITAPNENGIDEQGLRKAN